MQCNAISTLMWAMSSGLGTVHPSVVLRMIWAYKVVGPFRHLMCGLLLTCDINCPKKDPTVSKIPLTELGS